MARKSTRKAPAADLDSGTVAVSGAGDELEKSAPVPETNGEPAEAEAANVAAPVSAHEAEAAQSVGSEGDGEAAATSPLQPEPVFVGIDMAAPETRLYWALDPIRHGGTLYGPHGDDDMLELTEAEARPLLAAKVIELVAE